MMPDLPNVGLERDLEQFIVRTPLPSGSHLVVWGSPAAASTVRARSAVIGPGPPQELFANPAFRPDGLKLYPTLVIRGTGASVRSGRLDRVAAARRTSEGCASQPGTRGLAAARGQACTSCGVRDGTKTTRRRCWSTSWPRSSPSCRRGRGSIGFSGTPGGRFPGRPPRVRARPDVATGLSAVRPRSPRPPTAATSRCRSSRPASSTATCASWRWHACVTLGRPAATCARGRLGLWTSTPKSARTRWESAAYGWWPDAGRPD